jgi:hypothetical protein
MRSAQRLPSTAIGCTAADLRARARLALLLLMARRSWLAGCAATYRLAVLHAARVAPRVYEWSLNQYRTFIDSRFTGIRSGARR